MPLTPRDRGDKGWHVTGHTVGVSTLFAENEERRRDCSTEASPAFSGRNDMTLLLKNSPVPRKQKAKAPHDSCSWYEKCNVTSGNAQ